MTIKLSKKHIKLSTTQVENLKKLSIRNINTNTSEAQVLKLLRKMKIKKRFNVSNFTNPKFNCVIKPLFK
jgi:hypothetical protein